MLEREVKKLGRAGLGTFRQWFLKYDSDAWDLQIRRDIHSGKLAKLAKEALGAHKSGRTREL